MTLFSDSVSRKRTTSVLIAVFLAWCRRHTFQPHRLALLTKAFLYPNSLSENPMTQALVASPFSFGHRMMAHLFATASHWTHASSESLMFATMVLTWVAQALLMFRLAQDVTQSEDGAFLATLFFGVDMPFLMSDAPYALDYLERSLGMIPFLWAIHGLVRGRRWQALIGLLGATFFHVNPAFYLWPVLLLEEGLDAWTRPEARRGALQRVALLMGIAGALFVLVGHRTPSLPDPEFMGLSVFLHSPVVGGIGNTPPDYLFMAQGALLVLFFGWKMQQLPAAPLLLRAIWVGILMMLLGTYVSLHYVVGSKVWGFLARLNLWVARYWFDFAGQLLAAAWIARLLKSDRLWMAILWGLLLSSYHDFVSRFLVIALVICLSLRRSNWGIALTLATGLLSVLYHAAPEAALQLGRHVGLRGGIFTLPVFELWVGVALLVTALWGLFGQTWAGEQRHTAWSLSLVAGLALMVGVSRLRFDSKQSNLVYPDETRMALWIRQQTPPQTVILASPLYASGRGFYMPFMITAERSVYAQDGMVEGPFLAGNDARVMGDRMRDLGMVFSRIRKRSDYNVELRRADESMSESAIRALAKRKGLTYFLTNTARPWSEPPIHTEGSVALYHLTSSPS